MGIRHLSFIIIYNKGPQECERSMKNIVLLTEQLGIIVGPEQRESDRHRLLLCLFQT